MSHGPRAFRSPPSRVSPRSRGRSARLRVACVSVGVALACGGEPSESPEAAVESVPAPPPPVSAPAPEPVPDVSGVYQVIGQTVDKQSGDTREIFGTVVVDQQDDEYSTSFELKTEYPVEGGSMIADVIGEGGGRIEGGRMVGTSRTQLVMAMVPGVDTAFAFMPRSIGPRIVSRTEGTLRRDGTLEFRVENEAATEGGQGYRPTRTILRATRVADLGSDADPTRPGGPAPTE